MNILGIETSCDETAIAFVEASGNLSEKSVPKFKVHSNVVLTQIPLHRKYGGVYPSLAKREHAKNIVPVFLEAMQKAGAINSKLKTQNSKLSKHKEQALEKLFEREPELLEQFLKIIPTLKKPKIDAVAVTVGPGLEPALWVGINFAKALNIVWGIPVIPTNHMEGHAVSALLDEKTSKDGYRHFKDISYPATLLLVSGGHTELVLIKKPLKYKFLGGTRDDAAGEAFDKTARVLGLPYPGGPEIAKLAKECKSITANSSQKKNTQARFSFPRPMIASDDLDFSFSGLKTAVLYTFKNIPRKTRKMKQEASKEIEEAISEVLVSKTHRAIKKYDAKTLILGGGVTANTTIRANFGDLAKKEHFDLLVPSMELTTDNGLMIALAGYLRATESGENLKRTPTQIAKIKAEGSLELAT